MNQALEAIVQTTAIPAHADSGFHDVRPNWERFLVWLKHHRLECVDSWLRLWLTPASTLLAMCLMGLALAVPVGLYVLLENGKSLASNLPIDTNVTVFLAPEHSNQMGRAIMSRVVLFEGVVDVEFISKEQALESFSEQSGMIDTIRGLDENPLPVVLVVKPISGLSELSIQQLFNKLARLEGVDKVRLDTQWLRRLRALMDVMQLVLTMMAVGLGLTLVFVVLSATRLAIQERADEIRIKKLFGASNAYVRRPFLYSGVWLGFWSSLFALALVWGALSWMSEPLEQLLSLYQSDAGFHHIAGHHILVIFFFGVGFSWLGAWSATQRGF